MEIVWIVAIIGWLICGIAGAAILSRYHEEHIGCLLGFLLGPIGLVIAWTMRDSQKHKELLEATGSSPLGSNQQGRRKERNCPFCAELILIEAKICKYCRSEVEPEKDPIASLEDLGAKFTINKSGTVAQLNFSGLTINNADLISLREMVDLKTLVINNTPITDTGLVHLKGLASLQTLRLSSTSITDTGLVHLKGLTNLKVLSLSSTSITGTGLVHLKGLTNLQTLNLANTRITDAGLVHLKGLTNLKELSLRFCENITDAGLDFLKNSLPQCQVTGLKRKALIVRLIKKDPVLFWSIIIGCVVALLVVSIFAWAISTVSEPPPVISETPPVLPSRESESGSEISNAEESIAALEKLGVTIRRDKKGAVTFVLMSGSNITNQGVVHLKGLTNLQNLNLEGTNITDVGLVHLKGLTNLQSLYLRRCEYITDDGLIHLKGLTNLEYLRVLHCDKITDAGVVHFKGLTNLQSLTLYGCDNISPSGVAELQKALPNCNISR